MSLSESFNPICSFTAYFLSVYNWGKAAVFWGPHRARHSISEMRCSKKLLSGTPHSQATVTHTRQGERILHDSAMLAGEHPMNSTWAEAKAGLLLALQQSAMSAVSRGGGLHPSLGMRGSKLQSRSSCWSPRDTEGGIKQLLLLSLPLETSLSCSPELARQKLGKPHPEYW